MTQISSESLGGNRKQSFPNASPTRYYVKQKLPQYLIQHNSQRQNAMTPSLANFFYSILAGIVIVVIPVTGALIFISQKDKIQRN